MACHLTGRNCLAAFGDAHTPHAASRQMPRCIRETETARHLNERNLCETSAVRDHRRLEESCICRATNGNDSDPERFLHEEDGSVTIRDDLDALLQVLPLDIRGLLSSHPKRASLLEVILDLGRRPEARFLGVPGGEVLRDTEVDWSDLAAAEAAVGDFGGDNRAGVQGTLHRISAIRNRKGTIVGLTCRVGRAVEGHIDMIRDMLDVPKSLLFVGSPGVGKTTVIREMARVLADDYFKRVVIIDTSNEIGGDGDVPHPAVGGARRMQVPDPALQHRVMIEAVENHMPEILVIDEVGTEAEAYACRTIAERGVQLIGTAHGQILENLLKNPTLSDLVGGIQSVTLGDEEARHRGTQKSILERKGPATFPVVIEMRERALWVSHWTEESVDLMLLGQDPLVQVRKRDAKTKKVIVEEQRYESNEKKKEAPTEIAGFNSGNASDSDDPYAWVRRIQTVPDKDALQELAQLGYSSNNGMTQNRRIRRRSGRS